MKRGTLLDFFADRIRSAADFLVYDDGYRAYTYSYDEIRHAAQQFSLRLRAAGLQPGDKVIIWSENRPEWVVAMWGCWLARCVIVPVDYRASLNLLSRVVTIVSAQVLLVGDEVAAPPGDVERWPLKDLLSTERIETGSSRRDDDGDPSPTPELAEIIFTSGATADPKGVQLTHQNILANIVPVEREILKYRTYGRPFFPLRFLNLLPLSHMFGQAMATFIPPILPGVTVFMHGYNPSEIVRQVKTRRISVLVCVPKMLEVLRDHIRHVAPEVDHQYPAQKEHVSLRWWRYRRVHRLLGLKFWAFVVGAAPLDPELEAFWSRLGFLVIQGYGLTETAPIVTLNHPFHARQGTVGTPIGGVEVKIAPDGEILVRGGNVTSGYYNAPEANAAAFEDGWFHTGDVGTVDTAGRLSVRGRKKEIIVTPEGLNVFPEDVERVLLDIGGVRDAGVVGATSDAKERVHAALILEPGTDATQVVREANARLEDHQMVRGYSIWPGNTLPRTEGTQKLKRAELRRWIESGGPPSTRQPSRGAGSAQTVVQHLSGRREIDGDTTIAELGLSSIERIELTMALEQQFDRTVDEQALKEGMTVADLEVLMTSSALPPATQASSRPDQTLVFPTWNRRWAARFVRRVSLAAFLLPLTRLFAWTTVNGLDRLASTPDPVVYAANHQSHMDGPVILSALPARRRNRVATAAAKEFFSAHFHPQQHPLRRRLSSSLNYYLGSLLFNVFPLPQREAGTREAIRYLGELLSDGHSVLIFPEGRRTESGEIGRFQPGIGMIASRLQVPIVPVRIEGIDRILHQSWRMARPGAARVTFGTPLRLEGDDYVALAKQVEDSVRSL